MRQKRIPLSDDIINENKSPLRTVTLLQNLACKNVFALYEFQINDVVNVIAIGALLAQADKQGADFTADNKCGKCDLKKLVLIVLEKRMCFNALITSFS